MNTTYTLRIIVRFGVAFWVLAATTTFGAQDAAKAGVVRPKPAATKVDPRTIRELSNINVQDTAAEPYKPPLAAAVATIATPAPAIQADLATVRPATVVSVANASAAVDQWWKSAQEAQARGELLEAYRAYDFAEAEARTEGNMLVAGQAAFNQAHLLEAALAIEPTQAFDRTQIVDKYRAAIELAPPAAQVQARNNLAVYFLRQKEAAPALELMSDMDWSSIEPAQAPMCRYNYGRALELSGNTSAALDQYLVAAEVRLPANPAIDAAFRLSLSPDDVSGTAAFAETLIARGQAFTSLPHLRGPLQKYPQAAGAHELLTALVRAFAAIRTTPDDYLREDRKPLDEVAQRAPSLAPLIKDLTRAFEVEFKVDTTTGRSQRPLPAWSETEPQREAMSQLLKTLGDHFARPSEDRSADPSRAFTCYLAGWYLNPTNTDAVLYAAAQLQENRVALDPNGVVLRGLVGQLFEVKGNLYRIKVDTKADLLNLLRLHLVLGSIFEKEGAWGHDHDIAGVIFQLGRAIAIETQLHNEDPSFATSPDLYNRLGRAYVGAKRPADALGCFVKAAEGLLFFGQTAAARQSLEAATALQVRAAPDILARIDVITGKL